MKKKVLSILTLAIISCVCLFMLTACENGDNSGDTPPAHEHSYTQVVTPPTCEAQGYTTKTCDCGDVVIDTYVNALGHSFTTYVSDNNATCTVNGTETAKCDNCDATDTREIADSKLGHSFTNYISDNNATCTVNGTETATCNNCIETDTREKLNSKLGHSFTNYISDNNATCTVNGTETATCDNCIETDTREKLNSKLGHSFTNYVSDNNASYASDGTKTAKCDNCEATDTIVDEGSKLTSQTGQISFSTLSLDRLNAYGVVSNKTDEFNFNNEVTVSGNATYVVSYDKYGSQQVLTKIVPIYTGNNTFYIFEMQGANITKTYEVTIRRRPIYNVSFNTLGSYVESQSIEEDSLAVEPSVEPTRAGYTFDGYDFDFTTPITKNETVTALWTANDNTPYTVEYYLENLENEEYTLTKTENLTGVTDTTAYAEIKTFEHFTAEKQTVSGNINGNGTTVLKVYYQRNEYTVSNADKSLGSITGAGKYKYGKQITLQSSPILGYNVNWYSGEELLSDSLCYSVTIDKDITAKFAIKPEMANFNFTSTATTCVISGVKNKTITEITVPNYVTSIGEDAFYNCDSLTSIEIPNSVKSIGDYAFRSCDSLTSVTIGNGVTSIGSLAFSSCDSLTSVTIGNGVTSIGSSAFNSCDSLTSIVIPDSVTSIGGDAFAYCDSLTSIEIPDSVTSIGYSAFAYCDSLTSIMVDENNENYKSIDGNLYSKDGKTLIQYAIGKTDTAFTIPNSVTSIGDYAFRNCSSLTSIMVDENNENYKSIDGNLYSKDGKTLIQYAIGKTDTAFTIPNSVTSIGVDAFLNCDSLTSIEIPDSVTSIGNYAFYDCDSLTSIVIPDSVTRIGGYAFYDCDSLTSVTIGNNVTSIGSHAFENCSSLTSVVIPDTVTSIGPSAFSGCSKLYVEKGYIRYIKANGNDYFLAYEVTNKNMSSYTIQQTTKLLGRSLFDNCDRLSTITIPDSVTSIGYSAFEDCDSLTSAVIPDSVTSIGSYAFENCSSLTSIVIPDSVTSIGSYAFSDCDSLTSIVIPDSVTSIGSSAFYDCDKLVEVINKSPNITVEKGSSNNGYLGYYALSVSNCDSSYVSKVTTDSDGYVIYTNGEDKILVNYVGSQTELTLPSDITKINQYAFYSNDKITSIVIPDSVTSIGYEAFYDCDSLTSVTIGNGVTSIGNYAVYSCDSLTSIVIPDSVTSIGYYAFYSCDSLTSVVIPDSVTSIGYSAFSNCSSLTSIMVDENNENYKSIDGNLYSKDGKTLIQYAIGKTDTAFTIPNSVTSIGFSAFAYCYSLTSIVILDSVTSIGDYAFRYCSKLTSIVIPDSVTSIGGSAFHSCDSLTSVVIPDSVTSIGDYAFYNCDSLTSVTIGNGVTSIGSSAFEYCSSLTSVTIGNGVTSIDSSAFYYCTSLTSIKYRGTLSQWKAISKGDRWNYYTGDYTITYNYTGD